MYDRGMWSVLWERVPILFVQLENVEISRESRFRSLTCQTSYFARFHTIIGSSCASPNFMWCLKFVRKCSQYKFCNGWVDPSLDHWEYFGISTTFVKSITIVITFFVFCSIHAFIVYSLQGPDNERESHLNVIHLLEARHHRCVPDHDTF